MKNKFLEEADKKWENNGELVAKAIILLDEILADVDFNNIRLGRENEIVEARDNLLRTLMVDTPSGMFACAFQSMIEGAEPL